MFILILISGATYTLLESSSQSFKSSYNNVVVNGNLHDYVIKENFKVSSNSELGIKFLDNAANQVDISKANAESIAIYNLPNQRTGKITLQVAVNTGDYASLDSKYLQREIIFVNQNDNDFEPEWKQIDAAIKAYESDLSFFVEKHLSDQFISFLDDNYSNELMIGQTNSISVSIGEEAFNVVQYNSKTDVNKLVIYDGTEKFTKAMSDEQLLEELKIKILSRGNDPSNFSFNSIKGYRLIAKDASGNSISIEDPSSYQAIVSPAYANRNNKKSISPTKLVEIFNNDQQFMDKLIDDTNLQNKYKNNLIWVDKTPFFIIGIGTTPDYIYPIVDQAHPVIDVQNQAVVFTNRRGYERIYDGFRTNPMEEYISLKFNDNVTGERKSLILDEIEYLIHYGKIGVNQPDAGVPTTGYPANIKMVTAYNDQNDQILLAQERVTFLDQLQSTISTISITTTTMLIIFVSLIVILIFQMIITIDRRTIATQIALGYSRTKIALSKSLASIFIGAIPAIIGYLLGYWGQFIFIGHFDNYWTIPTFGQSFSWISLLVTVAFPLLLFWVLIFVVTLWTIKSPVNQMLTGNTPKGGMILAKIIAKFKILSVKGRYSVAIMAKNAFKLSLIAITATISIGALSVGISSIGKANYAYTQTLALNNYEFKIDLYSPTTEGGSYHILKENELEDLYNKTTYDSLGNLQAPHDMAHWHIPSAGDATFGIPTSAANNLAGAAEYLKHKLQVKALLDQEIGGLNPWEMALRLMPENQKNKAEEDGQYLETLRLQNNINSWEALKIILGETGNNSKFPYIISYGDVIVDVGDETYTYIDSSIGDQNYRIIGLRENTKMININDSIQKLKSYQGQDVPILINHFIANKLNLKVGSIIDFTVNNDANRNFNHFNQNKQQAKVVDIVNGYDDKGIYTLQKTANKVINLDVEQGFNGVFSQKSNPTILNTLPLYSPSGLWLGTDTIVGPWDNVLNQMLNDPQIWDSNNLPITNAKFFATYSRTPFVGATDFVSWSEINEYTFENISDLSSFIIILIESIAIALSIIFTVIISSLLLIYNRKKIATLWTLGYRRKEIGRIFLTTYILPIILATIIALPISYVILKTMKIFIMNFGNILIPFTLVWWAPIIAIVAVMLIFIGSTIFTIYNQKQIKALESFKGD